MLKKIADIILYSNLFVALCFTALTWQTFHFLEITSSPRPACVFIFLSTVFMYNFHRWYKYKNLGNENLPERIRWYQQHKRWIEWLIIISGVMLSIVTIQYNMLNKRTLVLLGQLFLIAALYTLPFIPAKGKWMRLRDIPCTKVIWVSLVVAGSAVMVPIIVLISTGLDVWVIPSNFFLCLTTYFFFIGAITIPFNIRDIDIDRAEGLKTIPVVWGVVVARSISLLLLLCYLICITLFYIQVRTFSSTALILQYILSLMIMIMIVRAQKNGNEYYYGYLLESAPLLSCLAVVAGNYF